MSEHCRELKTQDQALAIQAVHSSQRESHSDKGHSHQLQKLLAFIIVDCCYSGCSFAVLGNLLLIACLQTPLSLQAF